MSASLLPARMHSTSEHVSTGRALNWVTSGQPLTHGATLFVASSLPWATGGHVVERGSDVTASFIHLRSELAGDPAQNFTDRRPSGGLAFHVFEHGEASEQAIAKNLQGFARVRS